MTVKHSHAQCQQSVTAIKDLLKRIDKLEDETMRRHICESAIQICDQLLREPKK